MSRIYWLYGITAVVWVQFGLTAYLVWWPLDAGLAEFAARQRLVDAHMRERSAWECGGPCGACETEYKVGQAGVRWRNGSGAGGCEIECEGLRGVSVVTTMENGGCWRGGAGKICGNTRRSADVHMQYYSWAEVDFMRSGLSWGDKTSFISSFISNCGGGDRLQWMADLKSELAKRNESRVFNYGGCNRDAEEPLVGGRGRSKDLIARANRFVFSFENSQTEDYVTEKLFDMLSSGAVPVYRGATNARVYAPSRKSVVFAGEFRDAAGLAEYLLGIDEAEYGRYLEWKRVGPDLKWIAMVDEGIVHSECRVCMLAAEGELGPGRRWWVRERGRFHYVGVDDVYESWDELRYRLSQLFADGSKPLGSGAVVEAYRALDRNRCGLKSLEDMRCLRWGEKVEVVMENPGWLKREHFVDWWGAHGMPAGYAVV